MRIGITGHQRLENPSCWPWIKSEIDRVLTRSSRPLIGVSSLAIGADQLFAEAVLRHGGILEAIIPFDGYEAGFAEGHDRQTYRHLLNSALKAEVLTRTGSDEEAYFEAGKRVVDVSDLLVAVWNGKPAGGLGGTADIVRYARQRGKRVIHLDPHACTVIEVT